jgi:hypothetical protein
LQFSFSTCLEVDAALVEQALAPATDLLTPPPRARLLALLQRMCQVAEPSRGAPRILLVLAKMARCPWLDGVLIVRVHAEDPYTRIDLLTDDGISLERLCPSARINAPFQEFARAARLRPDLLQPLFTDELDDRRLHLRASERPSSRSESDLQVAARSLLKPERSERPKAAAPPIQWSKPNEAALARAEPPPAPPTGPVRQIEQTTRMPSQQAAELVARIKLKKQQLVEEQPAPPPDTVKKPQG